MANKKQRRLAAIRGWRTRRFKQRSAAARLGWRRRRKSSLKRQGQGKKRALKRRGAKTLPGFSWIVTVKLHSDTVEGEISRQREVDFIVKAPASATHTQLIKMILANKCTVRWTLGGPKTGERPADIWRWMTKTLGSDRRDIFGEAYCQVFFIRQRLATASRRKP